MANLAVRMATATQYRASSPLSDDQIARIAPSVFAQEAHSSRSARYTYVPTIEVLAGLRKEGFQPFMVAQGRTRVEGKAEFTKHMLRLRHASDIAGTEANEVILINSHDGTSSYQMLAGLIRFACCNGLVCGENMVDIRVKHSGNIIGNVIQGAYDVLDGFNLVREVKGSMQSTQLTHPEQLAFAESALMLKYDEEEPAPIQATQLLNVRRMEDRDSSLWTTFNRVQENVVRGGIHGRSANGRRMSTREVTAIDGNVKLNRALWNLAERMAELKSA